MPMYLISLVAFLPGFTAVWPHQPPYEYQIPRFRKQVASLKPRPHNKTFTTFSEASRNKG